MKNSKQKSRRNSNKLEREEFIKLLFKSIEINQRGNKLTQEEWDAIEKYYITKAPKKIYRYRPAVYDAEGKNRDFTCICNNQMWFSSPKLLNDPFDCQFSIDIDDCLELALNCEDLRAEKAFIQQMPLSLQIKAKNELKDELKSDLNAYAELQKIKDMGNDFGIASLSETNNSILMWGHYANGHKGICIEYDLKSFLKQKYVFIPVLYTETIPRLHSLDDSEGFNYVLHCLITKSKDWEYEAEWRCLQVRTECGSKWTGDGALMGAIEPSAIYIGCKAEENLINDVKAYCSEKNIPAYQMSPGSKEFKLNAEKLP